MRESCLEEGTPGSRTAPTFLKQPPPQAGGTETGSQVPCLVLGSLCPKSHLLFGLGANVQGHQH